MALLDLWEDDAQVAGRRISVSICAAAVLVKQVLCSSIVGSCVCVCVRARACVRACVAIYSSIVGSCVCKRALILRLTHEVAI